MGEEMSNAESYLRSMLDDTKLTAEEARSAVAAVRAEVLREAADWFDNANLSPEADQLRRMADDAERGDSA